MGSSGGRQASLATLLAYLDSISAARQGPGEPVVSPPLAANILASGQMPLVLKQMSVWQRTTSGAAPGAPTGPGAAHEQRWHNSYLVHVLAILVALVGSFFALKLLTRRLDKRVIRRRLGRAGGSLRSLWSSSASSDTDEPGQPAGVATSSSGLVSEKKHQAQLGAGNVAGRRFSTDSGLDTIATDDDHERKRKNLDMVYQRLMTMLHLHKSADDTKVSHRAQTNNGRPSIATPTILTGTSVHLAFGSHPTQETPAKEEQSGAFASQLANVESNVDQATRFRSSRSYIRSLIEALTKARSHVLDSASGETTGHSHDKSEQDDDEPDADLVGLAPAQGGQHRPMAGADEPGIIVSQMDISAAHLILDYMEKHLEDKERLRREWLELNAVTGPVSEQPASQRRAANKANQLVLQRLAKVALSEENRHKNRNIGVVPFDRNRVRLGQPRRSQTGNGQHQQRRHQDRSGEPASDYINASFIYDDDPRRPTHIIAQGPSEQTIGRFWQVSSLHAPWLDKLGPGAN